MRGGDCDDHDRLAHGEVADAVLERRSRAGKLLLENLPECGIHYNVGNYLWTRRYLESAFDQVYDSPAPLFEFLAQPV